MKYHKLDIEVIRYDEILTYDHWWGIRCNRYNFESRGTTLEEAFKNFIDWLAQLTIDVKGEECVND